MSASSQAAKWLLRAHAGDLNPAERYEFVRWTKSSPANIAELMRMARILGWLAHAKPIFNVNEDRFAAPKVANLLVPVHRTSAPPRTGKWLMATAAIAAIVIAATLALGDQRVDTVAGEWRTVTLGDGSIVSVGPRTSLHIDLTKTRRFITLLHGQADFRVAKDAARPFLVSTDLTTVRAVGTRFSVDRGEHRTLVTVAEGRVAVLREYDAHVPRSLALDLTASEQATVRMGQPTLVRRIDPEREMAWTKRRLIFDNETALAAAGAFNRCNRVQIVMDPAFGARSVRGAFDADDPRSFAQTLASAAGGTVIEEDDDTLRIRRMPAGNAMETDLAGDAAARTKAKERRH